MGEWVWEDGRTQWSGDNGNQESFAKSGQVPLCQNVKSGQRKNIKSHRELDVYQMAFQSAMRIFELTKSFPGEERYSLTDQIRRCSRSVCLDIGEAWRKRRYCAAFVSKISDAEAEAAETQVCLEFSVKCGYLEATTGRELYRSYEQIQGKLVSMALRSQDWATQR